jgi:hypothetical protein
VRIFVPRGTGIVGRRAPQRAMLDDFALGRDNGGIVYSPGHRVEGTAIVVDPSLELDSYIHEREDAGDARLATSVYLLDKGVWTHVDVWASPDGDPVMELPLSSRFPGYFSRRISPLRANELQRCEIVSPECEVVGTVVYVSVRRTDGRGTEYGWKPASTSNRRAVLTTKLEAIGKLPHFAV